MKSERLLANNEKAPDAHSFNTATVGGSLSDVSKFAEWVFLKSESGNGLPGTTINGSKTLVRFTDSNGSLLFCTAYIPLQGQESTPFHCPEAR